MTDLTHFIDKKTEFTVLFDDTNRPDPTDILVIEMAVKSTKRTPVVIDFYIGDEWKFGITQNVIPNLNIKVALELKLLESKNWFTVTRPGLLKGTTGGLYTDIAQVDKCIVKFPKSNEDDLIIDKIYITDTMPDLTVDGDIIVDEFGQNAAVEFEGKIHSEKELVDKLTAEYNEYLTADDNNGDLDRFGGYTKCSFEPKGYFYLTEKDGRNLLVDPLGNAFFSLGIGYGSASRLGCFGFVDGMEKIHKWLPDRNDEKFKDAYSCPNDNPEYVKRNGSVVGKDRVMFNFTRANLIRAFGEKWLDGWTVLLKGRMKKWGYNTICIGVDDDNDEPAHLYAKRLGIPFIYRMKLFPRTEKTIFRDFSDAFSDEYREKSKVFATQLADFLGDENFMGYYMYNEPEWMAAKHDIVIADLLLDCSDDIVSRGVMIDFLKSKYESVDKLNESWNTSFTSFDNLSSVHNKNDNCKADLDEFNKILSDKFWSVPSEECAKVTKGKSINFGYRSAGPWAASFGSGSDSCDVYSYNSYQINPRSTLALAKTLTDKPLLISEWHIGEASDALFTPGLRGATGQENRGIACRDYNIAAFCDEKCVGVHYFEYADMALLGRFDGAAAQIGFVNVCCLPYEKTMQIIADGNKNMYKMVCEGLRPDSLCDESILTPAW